MICNPYVKFGLIKGVKEELQKDYEEFLRKCHDVFFALRRL